MADDGYATKRAHPRQQVAAFVDYSGLRAQSQRVQNISLGGVCIHTEVDDARRDELEGYLARAGE